jgi:DNA repair exonuclease SbcCD ATPase subunit
MANNKKRVTQHSGRTNTKTGAAYKPGHNDRTKGIGDNVDLTRTHTNLYATWNGIESFEQAERIYYEQTYGEGLNSLNERYIKQGKKQQVKSIDDWLNDKQKAPEEVILQIGSVADGYPDIDTFKACVKDYIRELGLYKSNMTVLDYAIHLDESVPHVHIRRTWHYEDKDGFTRPGQEKALAKLNIPLPEPDKAKGRYNNRKMTFDAHMRERWIEICREHGLNIIDEPIPDAKHNQTKEEYIRTKYEQTIKATEQAEQRAERASEVFRQAEDAAQKTMERADRYHAQTLQEARETLQEIETRKTALNELKSQIRANEDAREQAEGKLQATNEQVTRAEDKLQATNEQNEQAERRLERLQAGIMEQEDTANIKGKHKLGHKDEVLITTKELNSLLHWSEKGQDLDKLMSDNTIKAGELAERERELDRREQKNPDFEEKWKDAYKGKAELEVECCNLKERCKKLEQANKQANERANRAERKANIFERVWGKIEDRVLNLLERFSLVQAIARGDNELNERHLSNNKLSSGYMSSTPKWDCYRGGQYYWEDGNSDRAGYMAKRYIPLANEVLNEGYNALVDSKLYAEGKQALNIVWEREQQYHNRGLSR